MAFEEEVKKEDLARFVRWNKNRLIEMLTDASVDTKGIAIQREVASILEADFNTSLKLLLLGGKGPIGHVNKQLVNWYNRAYDRALVKVSYETSSSAVTSIYFDKLQAFEAFLNRWAQREINFIQWVDDRKTGVRTVWEANPKIRVLIQVIKDQALDWWNRRTMTPAFLRRSAGGIVETFFSERPDVMILVEAVIAFPKLKYTQEIEIERDEVGELLELALSFVPVLGSAISLYEAWEGRDLSGVMLSNLERGVLVATVLLPAAGRLFKGGKAVYTEARLARMYGRSEAEWGRAIRLSGQATERQGALKVLQESEEALLKSGRLEATLAKEVKGVLPQLTKAATTASSRVSVEVKAAWAVLSQKHPSLAVLDEIALERIIQKGANESHVKGQLLEELMEAHIVPQLRQREVGFALGVAVPEGKVLEYVPGHAIRSASEKVPLQLTDGMVGYRDGNVFHILGIFEAKAGKKGTRELLIGSKELSQGERLELRAFANDTWRDERNIAKRLGKPYTRTVQEVEADVSVEESTYPGKLEDVLLTGCSLRNSKMAGSSSVTSKDCRLTRTGPWHQS